MGADGRPESASGSRSGWHRYVVVADPKIVRAAAADVKITFTYTSTQTIQDGELRFTVPSGWSAPQVSDAGVTGLYRRRWKRSRNL